MPSATVDKGVMLLYVSMLVRSFLYVVSPTKTTGVPKMDESTRVKYFLVDIETGKHFGGMSEEQEILSPLPPKIGEYLNQSGIYFKVVTLLQHFDAGYVEVFAESIGSSEDFLNHVRENNR